MSNPIDLLLVELAASYNPPEPKAKAVKAPKAPKAIKAEIANIVAVDIPKRGPGRPRKNPAPTAEVTPEVSDQPKAANPLEGIKPGDLTAEQFLAALQTAGKRDGKPTPDTYHWDQVKAIHGFCGFSHKEPFGIQLDNSVRRAKTVVNGVVFDKPKPSLSVKGYISGIPNNLEKTRLDLQGRYEAALDAKNEALSLAEKASSESERNRYLSIAALEGERAANLSGEIIDENALINRARRAQGE